MVAAISHITNAFLKAGTSHLDPLFQTIPYLSFAQRKFLLDTCRVQVDPRGNPIHREFFDEKDLHIYIPYEYHGDAKQTNISTLLDLLFQQRSLFLFSLLSSCLRSIPCHPSRYDEAYSIIEQGIEKEIHAARGPDRSSVINWETLMADPDEYLDESMIYPSRPGLATRRGAQIVRSRLCEWRSTCPEIFVLQRSF